MNGLGRVLSAELDLKKLVQALTDAATTWSARSLARSSITCSMRAAAHTRCTRCRESNAGTLNVADPSWSALLGPASGLKESFESPMCRRTRDGCDRAASWAPVGYLPGKLSGGSGDQPIGELLGGLFFGHAEAAVFTDADERVISGLAAQAAIAIDNARFSTPSRRRERPPRSRTG